MSKKKILYLRSTSVVNDSRACKEIKCYLKAGYNVTVLCWNRQCLKDLNIEYFGNKANILAFEKEAEYGSGLKNILKLISFQIWILKQARKLKNDYNIIHACDFDTSFIASKIAKKYKKKFIYDIYDYYVDCHTLGFLKSFVERMDIKTINSADCVILCTEQRKKQIKKANPKKMIVIHNTPEIHIQFKTKKINLEKIKVCYVGILQDDRLLLEISELFKNNKKFELHVGGFGKYEEYFKQLSEQYDNIKFYGQMKYDDVLKLEHKCDFLFATYNPIVENHKFSAPNKVYEAMALGKPIIVCKDTGVDKLVESEKIGYTINYDAISFMKCLENILEKDYEDISNRTRQLYYDKYAWTTMEEKIYFMVENLDTVGGKK